VLLALLLHRKAKTTRKFIAGALGIYVLVLVATALYFVPGLLAFAKSADNSAVPAEAWLQRGQTWQYLSWVRGSFMLAGFILLLIALVKNSSGVRGERLT
jgi:uncharacterized protein YybS (DUF2232 family)